MWTVILYVTAKNEGTMNETFNVTVYLNNTAIGEATVTNLAPGANTTKTIFWSVGGTPIGYYTLWAEASVVPGEEDTADNTMDYAEVFVAPFGDANGDGHVTLDDLTILAGNWYKVYPHYDYRADFNGDGKVTIANLTLLAALWYKI